LYKHWVHEGGIATPLIAHWPAAMPDDAKGGISHSVGHLIDVMPTILEATGAGYPTRYDGREVLPLEGESLLPVVRGDLSWGRTKTVFWEHEGNRAVRSPGDGRWKLVRKFPGEWELYDMHADRTELSDLTVDRPEQADEMAAAYDEWAARCGVLPWEEIRPQRRQGR